MLILGCKSFISVEQCLMRELKIPVLKTGNVAVKTAELLYDLALTQNKKAYPDGEEHYKDIMNMIRRNMH